MYSGGPICLVRLGTLVPRVGILVSRFMYLFKREMNSLHNIYIYTWSDSKSEKKKNIEDLKSQ